MKNFRVLKEDLRQWFNPNHPKGGWKRINSKGEAIGPCAREPGEAKPKCMSNEKRAKLSKKERASAVAAKRRHDPNPERKGKPINVSNFGKGKISEDMENLDEKWSQKYKKSIDCNNPKGFSQRAHCQGLKKNEEYQEENMEQLDEKNVPTSPEKWAQAKAQAKAKFDVYPSAYANGWAAKKYKAMGGGWKSVSEETVDEACWTGYTAKGMKNKGGKMVPNCVPVTEVKEVGDDPTGDTPPENLVKKGNKVVAKHAPFEEQHAEKGRFRPKIPYNVPVSHVASPRKKLSENEQLDELSNTLLARYKAAAGVDASKADKSGDYNKGDKRFKGIMTATKKQFNNDMKNEAKDVGEYDQEGDMAKTQLRSIIYHAQELHDQLSTNDNLPEWVQSKITLAQDYVQTACDYMYSQKNVKEEVELTEGRPSQRHPLEGHEYHRKSDEALIHIAKDAHAAAEAMKSHNTTAENKYRDQANDSATVRHYRKTHGMADWYKKKYGHMNESDAYDKDVKPSDKPYDKEAAAKRAKIAAVMARKKMAKEEVEQLDELSPSTLQSYKVAGHKKYDSIRNNTDSASMAKKAKLEKGIKTAHAKQYPSKPAAAAPKKDPNSRGYEQGRYMGDSVEHDESLVEGESWKVDTGWKKSKSDEVTDKSGAKHTAMSRAKHLAKMAAKRNGKPMREDAEPIEKAPEEAPKKTRKAQIVKDTKKATVDKFQSEPELSSTITKNY